MSWFPVVCKNWCWCTFDICKVEFPLICGEIFFSRVDLGKKEVPWHWLVVNICNFAWVTMRLSLLSIFEYQRTKLDFAFISLQIGRCMLEPVPLEIVRGEERSHVTVFWFANQLYYSIWSLQACQSSELELFQKCEARNKEHENPFPTIITFYLENMGRGRLFLS